jgi:SAM-dependent methyltransferase
MPKYPPQLLGRGNNPLYYAELIDGVGSEGRMIREKVIFPTLFSLMRQTLGDHAVPLLDYGSGTGSLTEQLSRRLGLLVEGVDVSARFVRLAQAAYPHLRFYKTSMKRPVGYGMHNANAHLVLHCTPHPEEVLENMADCLEPDGHAFVTVPHADYFKATQLRENPGKKAYVVKVGDKAMMTYYPLTPLEYENLFKRAGFTVVAKRSCVASKDSPPELAKYKKQAWFIVYALQKKEDTVDTALIMHADTGKVLLLTRALNDDKFPGAKSLFSVRRAAGIADGPSSLAQALPARLGIQPQYISPHPLGSLRAKHRHGTQLQHAKVNLYAVKIHGSVPGIRNAYYDSSQLVSPMSIRPSGGACTQLAYEFFRSH